MTITIFGVTGMVGKYIVKQALANGIKVNVFGRNIEKLIDADLSDENFVAIKGYVFDEDEVLNAIKNADAVISVLGGAFDGTDKTRSLGIKNIVKQMQKTNVKRILALGGLGVLQADENSLLLDSPEYPRQYLAVGHEHLAAYKLLEASPLDWTFVCPPNIIDIDADGKYLTSKNYPPTGGKQEVAAGNIADFMLRDLSSNQYIKSRVGIVDAN
jgi:hypothetical protein